MAGGSSRRYPPELRERAVRVVAEISGQHDSEWAAISEVARLLVGFAETVRKWGARPKSIGGPTRLMVSSSASGSPHNAVATAKGSGFGPQWVRSGSAAVLATAITSQHNQRCDLHVPRTANTACFN